MAHHRDARTVLDVLHERVAPTRNHQVDVLVAREQRCNLAARLDCLDVRRRERGVREPGADRGAQQLCRSVRFFAALQYRGVACAFKNKFYGRSLVDNAS